MKVFQFRLLQYELAHKLPKHLPHGVHAGVVRLHVVDAMQDSYLVPSEKAECLHLIDGIPLRYEIEQVAQLLLSQFFPPCGKFEVDSLSVFIHNKNGCFTAKVNQPPLCVKDNKC